MDREAGIRRVPEKVQAVATSATTACCSPQNSLHLAKDSSGVQGFFRKSAVSGRYSNLAPCKEGSAPSPRHRAPCGSTESRAVRAGRKAGGAGADRPRGEGGRLAGIYLAVGERTVLPRGRRRRASGHGVVDVSLAGREFAAGVLANASIARQIGREEKVGLRFGTFEKRAQTMAVGTRTWPRGVCTEWSRSRTGRTSHSVHFTGIIDSESVSESRGGTRRHLAKKASAGVRVSIACQLRFSTRTVVLLRMSLIGSFSEGEAGKSCGVCSFTPEPGLSLRSFAQVSGNPGGRIPAGVRTCKRAALLWIGEALFALQICG